VTRANRHYITRSCHVSLGGSGRWHHYKRGDANLDGTADGRDFILWNESKLTSRLLWNNGDFTGDEVVDGLDYIKWNGNKFTSSDGVTAVPELSAGMLSFVARVLIGVASVRR